MIAAEVQLPVGGYGALTCSEAIKVPLEHASTKWALRDWIAGFVSGINVAVLAEHNRHLDLRGPWANEMYSKMLGACAIRPNDMFAVLVLEEIARTPQMTD